MVRENFLSQLSRKQTLCPMMTGRNQRQLPFVFAFALTIFYYTLSCDITISPIKISALNGSTITVTCSFANCNNEGPSLTILEKRYDKADYEESGFLSTPTPFGNNSINFSDTVSMSNNGSLIFCYDPDSNTKSASVAILVQDSIDAVTDCSIRKTNIKYLRLSWIPVFAYEGLIVQYRVIFNSKAKNIITTRTKLNIVGLDTCQFANLSITSIINGANNRTLINANQWSIPIKTPPKFSLNYTMSMSKNGSISLDLTLKFNLTNCKCPGRLNDTLLTITSSTHTFNDVPIRSDNNCTGFANLLLPPFANITSIALKNFVGKTKPKIFPFETNPLRNISYPSSSSVQCEFTDSFMITNNYSTGCLYYNNTGEPVYIPRENYESIVTAPISINGTTCFLPIPLPFQHHCQNVVSNLGQTSSSTPSTSTYTSKSNVLSVLHENYDIMLFSGVVALLGAFIGTSLGGLLLLCVIKCRCGGMTLDFKSKNDPCTLNAVSPVSETARHPNSDIESADYIATIETERGHNSPTDNSPPPATDSTSALVSRKRNNYT